MLRVSNWESGRLPTPRSGEDGASPVSTGEQFSGSSTGAIFGRGSGHGLGENGSRSMCRHQRHVDVFEEGLGGDAHYAAAGLDEIVAGTARLFAAECVGKNEWFGELTGAHQKTGAVEDPLAFRIHVALSSTLPQGKFDSGLSLFGFEGKWSLLETECLFRVERLYAHRKSGSIP